MENVRINKFFEGNKNFSLFRRRLAELSRIQMQKVLTHEVNVYSVSGRDDTYANAFGCQYQCHTPY